MKKQTTLQRFIFDEYYKYANANLKPKTVDEYRRLINSQILPEFGSKLLTTLSTAGIERWHLGLRQATPIQANRALAVLSAILQLAARWGYILANPARGIPIYKEKARERYLDPHEVKRFMNAVEKLPAVEGAFLLTALYTGARPGELLSARWEWLHGDVLELPDSKTGRRTIYLPHAAKVALSASGCEADGLIFPGVNPTLLWRRVRRKCNLRGVRLYDLRHTFASAALSSGAPLEAISQLLGHKNPKTTRRYVHLMKDAGNKTVADTAGVLDKMAVGL